MVNLERRIRPFYSLNIDSHIMGLGGDDSWTASVHEGNSTNKNSNAYTNSTTSRFSVTTRIVCFHLSFGDSKGATSRK